MIFLLLIFNIGRVDVLADGLSVFSYVAAPAVGFLLLVSCLLTFVVLRATVARRESGDWPDLRAIARLFSSLRKETKSLISNSLFKRKEIPGNGITIVVAGGEEDSISNKLKRWFKGVTGQKWNCWPFAPTFLPLQSDHSRIKFKFHGGCTHWLDVSTEFLPPSKRQRGDSFILTSSTNDSSSDGGSSEDLSQGSSSNRGSSPATLVGTSSSSSRDHTSGRDTQPSRNQ
ncbi:hypothetical protein L207DRAFT_305961 [Hyaloscypha variabilis F]|uniref:Uncharacterized protein n=1 Tax=Hyaloscypha variabilis (strain UAMH 11265 / GT02V1 / F) TaxID=1149755 RepID=A0A2J6RU94_HYAVF|nr:hypothetical protein L207DRAFT_305961 [Hyaloscypha variabilis F]